jgi:PRTRC genetic system ThiF family protein
MRYSFLGLTLLRILARLETQIPNSTGSIYLKEFANTIMNVFDPNLHVKTVTVVGLGGTGAQIARQVARIVYDMQRSRLHAPQIVLIDPDTVEAKNVGRQLFTEAEIGQNKALALMRRFNCALGLEIVALPEAVNAEAHFERYGGNLVIGAVDNHLARRELARIEGLWLDCGNHRMSGQVVLGNTCDPDLMLRHIQGNDGKYAYLPNAALLFPALLEPEPTVEMANEQRSCADLVLQGDQHLLVNDWMACAAASYLYALLRRQPVTTFATFVSLDGLSVRSLPICHDELMLYLN